MVKDCAVIGIWGVILRSSISPTIIATEIMMTRVSSSIPILLVEGESDYDFLSSYTDGSEILLRDVGGRENVVGALHEVAKFDFSHIGGMIDRDYDRPISQEFDLGNSFLAITSAYDMEMEIVHVDRLAQRVFRNLYGSRAMTKVFDISGERTLLDAVEKLLKPVAAVRSLDLHVRTNLPFKNFTSEYLFDFKSWEYKFDGLRGLLTRQLPIGVDVDALVADLRTESSVVGNSLEFVNGHDFCDIMGQVGRTFASSARKSRNAKSFEDALRGAVGPMEFLQLPAIGSITNWFSSTEKWIWNIGDPSVENEPFSKELINNRNHG